MSAGAGGGGAGAVVRQGHLRKLKTMKKKYFVLRAESQDCSARLEYYESEKKFRAGAVPRRVLPLKSCYNITRRLDLKQKHVIALFTREEQFCIVAENEQDLHAWLTAILKQHRSDDASEELLHPIQHVWQVNVQKKGLGSSKNIQGLYNLCLTDKTLTLVKIKSHNNVISDLGIPERIEYSLKNIRRCGDSECFFYMEVGRQTSTGAGELWMHSDDSNIAQSMHSTIYLAMRNCAKETENERDHIILPVEGSLLQPRSQSMSVGSGGRAGLANDAGPLRSRCDSMPSRASSSYEVERPVPRHNDLEVPELSRDEPDALAEWYRTPRIPEEPDCVDASRDFLSSGGRVGGPLPAGASVHHSRTSSIGADESLDGYLPMAPGHEPLPPLVSASSGSICSGTPSADARLSYTCVGASAQHSRTSSLGADEALDGYLPMAPGHEPLPPLVSASSGSVCSGTPSTDPRFSEYQLEPATSHIVEGERPPRAWSVGSRAALGGGGGGGGGAGRRDRAYSVGARCRPQHHPPHPRAPTSAPLLPRPEAEDLMELDFSANSPQAKVIVSMTPPTGGFIEPRVRPNVDEYVDMSPRNAAGPAPRREPSAPQPDGYVEMNYTRAPTRPIAIAARAGSAPGAGAGPGFAPAPPASPPRRRDARTPLGSQTIFPISLDSPASPPDLDAHDAFDDLSRDEPSHPLTTVREISEEAGRLGGEAASSPQYVRLALAANPTAHKSLARPPRDPHARADVTSTATVVVAGARGNPPARFSVGATPPATPPPTPTAPEPLNYAALDLQPRRNLQPHAPRTYTQIDFVRSEKLHAADGT